MRMVLVMGYNYYSLRRVERKKRFGDTTLSAQLREALNYEEKINIK